MKKILVSDFDNTLYKNTKDLILNINAINSFVEKGNIFIIATGRCYKDISKFTIKYNIPFNYLICNDGATIFDSNGNLIYKKNIPYETGVKIIEYLKLNKLMNKSYIDTGFDYTKDINYDFNGIIIRAFDKEESQILLNNIINNFEGIHGYMSDNWINIIEQSVNKASGIEVLCKMNNYDKNSIYTIGDTVNDIPMIKNYNSACMINSTNDLKENCTKSFNSVREYIEYIEKQ
ncbi:MAG: HAD family phosphatase [Bacilli bacterium]|nr:HAD family phosphatase [Bacilli bacterium]